MFLLTSPRKKSEVLVTSGLLTLSNMRVVRRRRLEVVFAAMLAHDWLSDLMRRAQVKDEMMFGFDLLVAELADELQAQNHRTRVMGVCHTD